MASVILSPLPSAAALLARVRRVPFPVLAAAVGLVLAAAGVAVVDDYGVGADTQTQRDIAYASASYIMGDRDAFTYGRSVKVSEERKGISVSDRYYGVAFELPLLLFEHIPGLRDSRDILLVRHLLTHLFFIAGGFFCGLLAYRMLGSRWAGLLAMLLFLLHPRLYAHSFINSKDIPFLVMFVIALYLTHRAFRRDTVGAFVLLGAVVGMAVNMRPFALLLPAAVLAMRGMDWGYAYNFQLRKRIVVTGGVFAAAVLLAIYVSHPYYWENPLRFIEGIQRLSQHPVLISNLFQGQFIRSDAVPPYYIPVWFGITAPPVALLLGGVGLAAVCWRGLGAPGQILRSGELRFLFLLLSCFALPVAVVIALQSNTFNGWRHTYFLWAPFCLLAAGGLHWLAGRRWVSLPAAARRWRRVRAARFPGKDASGGGTAGNGNRRQMIVRQIIMCGAIIAVLVNAIYALVSLHPHQQVYFNLLVNRAASDELAQQYDLDYWAMERRQALEYLLERYPDAALYVITGGDIFNNRAILPAADRERIVLSDEWTADFHIWGSWERRYYLRMAPTPVIYERRAYDSAYLTITAPRLVWGAGLQPGAEVYRAAYQAVTADGPPAARALFDIYIRDGVLYYVKEDCAPADAEGIFYLHLFPADAGDLPSDRGEYGFDNRDFKFVWRGGFFDGKCITQVSLPDYPIDRIRTGQYLIGGATIWQTEINLSLRQFQEIEAGLANSRPAASGDFDLYLDGDRVIYYKDACGAGDTEARFFLHVFPADAGDLPADRREYGFSNVGFDFGQYGVRRGGKCLAAVPLPGYEIARIRAGQYLPGQRQLWRAEFAAGGGGNGIP